MRSIPTITRNLLIINVIAFIAALVFNGRGVVFNDIFGLHFFLASDFHVYQLFTYMFMHADFTHLFFNMFALWMFGCVVERVWGPKKFLFYYISCGIGAGLLQEVSQFMSLYLSNSHLTMAQLFSLDELSRHALNAWTTVGASGAIYAILLAFGMLFPNERIFIFPLPIPIKAKWFVMFYVAVELFSALGTSNDNVAHFAHLGGMLFGFLMIKYWQKHPESGQPWGNSKGQQFFDNMRSNWERRTNRSSDAPRREQPRQQTTTRTETDQQYNARKKREQDEIDIILDKIRKSGYESLTKEEKKKLFDASKK